MHKTAYGQYGVLVNDKDAQDAESNCLAVQAAQKHIYLHMDSNYMPTKRKI